MPRFGFALRTASPADIQEAIREFDTMVDEAIENIIQDSLDEKRRALVGLPLSWGGLGVPRAQDIAWSAFAGSMVGTIKLQKNLIQPEDWSEEWIRGPVDEWNRVHKGAGSISMEELQGIKKPQHHLSNQVHEHTLNQLQKDEEATFRATVLACGVAPGGMWTDVFPTPFDGLTMPSKPYRFALKYRLGLSMFAMEYKCLHCKGSVDRRGHHLATCPGIHGRAHDDIRDVLFGYAKQAQFDAKLEPTGLMAEVFRDNDRPADIYIPNFANGKPLCVDVTIVSSFSDMEKASTTAGHNAARAAKAKRAKYEAHLEELGFMFVPFAMESIGGFGEDCEPFLQKLGRRWSNTSSEAVHGAIRKIKQKISFVWQRSLGYALESHAHYLSEIMAGSFEC
jgi:hypothetical protein